MKGGKGEEDGVEVKCLETGREVWGQYKRKPYARGK